MEIDPSKPPTSIEEMERQIAYMSEQLSVPGTVGTEDDFSSKMHRMNESLARGRHKWMYDSCFIPATSCDEVRGVEEAAKVVDERLKRPTSVVLAGARMGNPDDILEYGLRKRNDQMDEEKALEMFSAVLTGDSFPNEKRAIAASLAAYTVKYRILNGPAGYTNTQAFLLAERSCQLGLFSYTCFDIVAELGAWSHEPAAQDEYRNYPTLWARYEKFRKETGMQPKHARRCARCDSKMTHRVGLSQCSGGCEAKRKPVYCSRECQKADWKSHRKWCNKN